MEQGYDNVYDKIKELEKKLKELASEYIEKQQQLDKIVAEMNEKDIFTGIKKKCEPLSLERKLKLEHTCFNNFEIATEFYNKYSSLWKYVDQLVSIEETEENIGILVHYMSNNNDEIDEDLRPVKGIAGLSLYFEFDNTVYIVAAVFLRLENMNFRDTMNLVQECRDQKEQIELLKEEIKDYKTELATAILDGTVGRATASIGKVVKPTINNVIKPGIDNIIKPGINDVKSGVNKGIKSLIRRVTRPIEDNQESEE